jgi:hypothetical protein
VDLALLLRSSAPLRTSGAEFGYGVWVYLEYAQRQPTKQIVITIRVRIVMGKDDNSLKFQFQQANAEWASASTDYVPLARWVPSWLCTETVTFFLDGGSIALSASAVSRQDRAVWRHDRGGGGSFRRAPGRDTGQ